jgi:ATP synthase protein I
MSEPSENERTKDRTTFSREVGAKAARKLRAQRHVTQGVWFGLGMMGLIGWSVAIPTLLGAALGIWLTSAIQAPIPGRWHYWWLGSQSAV